jgi:hypothetical protein
MKIGYFGALLCSLLIALFILACPAHAEPYLAVQTGLKCGQCHVNPTGGGLRTVFGDVFAQTVMPHQHLDTGPDTWVGEINRFLSVGGDLRFDGDYERTPGSPSVDSFALQQARIYVNATVIPTRLAVYVDEQVAPGGALNREAYGMYWSAAHEWYLKAGQLYLPFGLRLQDQTAFIQTASGINMTTPDQGAEFGWEHNAWDAQFAVSNGTASGPVVDHGKQYSGQLIYVEQQWRLGLGANLNDASAVGSKSALAVFGGLKTGPIAWLAQGEVVDDKSIPNGGGRMLATLLEANWLLARGNNLKITDEFLDPNRAVGHNEQTRWSLVYELTPIQFLQLRAGVRYSDGIPQDDSEHVRLFFVEVHGFF